MMDARTVVCPNCGYYGCAMCLEEQGFDANDPCLTCGELVGSHSFVEMVVCLAKQGRFRDEEE